MIVPPRVGGQLSIHVEGPGLASASQNVASFLPEANDWYAQPENLHVVLATFNGIPGSALRRWLDDNLPFPAGGVRLVCTRLEYNNNDPAVPNPYPIPLGRDGAAHMTDLRPPPGAELCNQARVGQWEAVLEADAGTVSAARDVSGWSLLHIAAWWGDRSSAEALLALGCKIQRATNPPPLDATPSGDAEAAGVATGTGAGSGAGAGAGAGSGGGRKGRRSTETGSDVELPGTVGAGGCGRWPYDVALDLASHTINSQTPSETVACNGTWVQ